MVSLSNDEDDYIFTEIHEKDEDEYINLLYKREKPLQSLSSTEDWTQCARFDSISWILRIRAKFGFRFQTAYISVAYFDQFLSRRSIDRGNDWAIRLLSVACLRIAAKMEELNVPPPPEFFSVEQGDMYWFESNVVQRMELLVLSTLDWNMRLVTPFSFINYYIAKYCRDRLIKSIISSFTQIIMASMIDLNLMSYRQSILAHTATLVALDSKLTVPDLELKINNAHSSSPSECFNMADIVSCYDRMKEWTNIENVSLHESIVKPNLSRMRWAKKEYSESYVISRLGNKRKRLVYEHCNQNYGIPDEKRLP